MQRVGGAMVKGVVTALALLGALELSGCVGGAVAAGPEQFLSERNVGARPVPGAFGYCRDHGCNRVVRIRLTQTAWAETVEPLRSPSASAAEERERLKRVVGSFERHAAHLAGTSADRGGTGYGAPGQLDCVDETANTTVLLLMLQRAGLLRWHQAAAPAGRGNLVDGLTPHRTAAIVEPATGVEWVVDSWFHDNGMEPEVVAMTLWLSGWSPEDATVPATAAAPASRPEIAGQRQATRDDEDGTQECCGQAVDSGDRHREGSSDQAPQT